jgi:hypothetical protein
MAVGGKPLHRLGVTTVSKKSKPPLPGGEHVETRDTGPQAVPTGLKVVNLVAVGDGGPGALLPRNAKPPQSRSFIPNVRAVAILPRLARVAFAARCVRRVFPLVQTHRQHWVTGVENILYGLDEAARSGSTSTLELSYLSIAWNRDGSEFRGDAADDALFAAFVAADSYHVCTAAAAAAASATSAMRRAGSDPSVGSAVHRDLHRIVGLAAANSWTDDTPVPPDAFGPMWSPDAVPNWAKDIDELPQTNPPRRPK